MLCASWIISNVLLASLLALAAWFVQRWLRRPAIAHFLWVLVLVKLVTPPLVSVSLQDTPENTPCQNGTCRCGPHVQSTARAALPWMLLAAWGVGAAVMSRIAWCRWKRFRSLLAHAVPAPPEWQALADRLAAELALRQPPEVLAVPGPLPPMVVPGSHRPRLLLPMDLMDRLTDAQRTVLVLHELIHLQRRDHLVRLLELAVRVAYWWLPGLSVLGRQLRACEEACCDDAVLARQPHARRDYARLLLDVLDFVAPAPRAVEQATAMSSATDLERRLRAILDTSPRTPPRWPVGAVAVGLACALVPCGLHYDWARALAPAGRAAEREPLTAPTPSPNGDREAPPTKLDCCCPS
jgi:beta-lactamase regulating signal transducer with metallopeptidase domain